MLGSGTTSGTFRVNIACFSADPTPSPTKRPSKGPTKRPTGKPTPSPVPVPTPSPVSVNPTKRPTPGPTKRPTTKDPTKRPTMKPTTPSPTQPGAMTCGASTVGAYSSGDQLIFEVSMPFTGELIFDASNSNFDIAGIEAFTKLDSYLGSDSDRDGTVSLNPAVVGDYKFILMGSASGIYHVKIHCVSDEPTVSPTKSPTPYPSKRPSYAPVNHPITPHPSEGPTPGPSVAGATVRPTDRPTDRPTLPGAIPTKGPVTDPPSQQTSTTEDSNDQGSDEDDEGGTMALTASADLRIAVYVLSSFIICCVCLCVMFVFYRFCLGDMKQVMHIQNEMMGDTAAMHKDVQTNVVPVNSGDWTIPQAEVDFERDLVVQWLRHTVKLPQYAETFFSE
eukprot:289643_1